MGDAIHAGWTCPEIRGPDPLTGKSNGVVRGYMWQVVIVISRELVDESLLVSCKRNEDVELLHVVGISAHIRKLLLYPACCPDYSTPYPVPTVGYS